MSERSIEEIRKSHTYLAERATIEFLEEICLKMEQQDLNYGVIAEVMGRPVEDIVRMFSGESLTFADAAALSSVVCGTFAATSNPNGREEQQRTTDQPATERVRLRSVH